MLFITNRTPVEGPKSKKSRKISFDYQNTSVSQDLYFCERTSEYKYREIKSPAFFKRLKEDLPPETQLLFYIHGFNNNMEPHIFNNSIILQDLLDSVKKDLVHVVPLIWPCDDDTVLAFADDYWDDQRAAEASAEAFTRLIGKFDNWRKSREQQEVPCLRRINILAHSMGNRVLEQTVKRWAEYYSSCQMPQLFRNIFMVAADVENHTLEKGFAGQYIVDSGRNVVVYYANDDLAMPASKLANLKNKTVSRRLGMTGPEDLQKLPRKVYEVDCDEFNNLFDPIGHTYFLTNKEGKASPVIKHMADAIRGGRVIPDKRSLILN